MHHCLFFLILLGIKAAHHIVSEGIPNNLHLEMPPGSFSYIVCISVWKCFIMSNKNTFIENRQWWYTPVIPAMWKEYSLKPTWTKCETLPEKQSKRKKGWSMTQRIEQLPTKTEALSSNPSKKYMHMYTYLT
jgi:hypothetical protein